MRCLSLAEGLLKKQVDVLFCCKMSDEFYSNIVCSKGFKLYLLQNTSLEIELEQLNRQIEKFKPDVIILDGYSFDYDYQKRINENHALIVDMAWENDFRSLADIVINQNIWASADDYKGQVPAHTRMLLGTKYALVPSNFANSTKETQENCNNILITFGGGINSKYGIDIYNILKTHHYNYTVALSSSIDWHKDECNQRLRIVRGSYDLYPLMRYADMAICAPGAISWELCCLGIPFLTYVTSKNQEPTAQGLHLYGAAIHMGWIDWLDPVILKQTVTELAGNYDKRKNMSNKGKTLVDGHGVERVVKEIISLISQNVKGG